MIVPHSPWSQGGRSLRFRIDYWLSLCNCFKYKGKCLLPVRHPYPKSLFDTSAGQARIGWPPSQLRIFVHFNRDEAGNRNPQPVMGTCQKGLWQTRARTSRPRKPDCRCHCGRQSPPRARAPAPTREPSPARCTRSSWEIQSGRLRCAIRYVPAQDAALSRRNCGHGRRIPNSSEKSGGRIQKPELPRLQPVSIFRKH